MLLLKKCRTNKLVRHFVLYFLGKGLQVSLFATHDRGACNALLLLRYQTTSEGKHYLTWPPALSTYDIQFLRKNNLHLNQTHEKIGGNPISPSPVLCFTQKPRRAAWKN